MRTSGATREELFEAWKRQAEGTATWKDHCLAFEARSGHLPAQPLTEEELMAALKEFDLTDWPQWWILAGKDKP